MSNCQAGYIEIFLSFNRFTHLFRDYECHGNTGRAKPDNLRAIISRNGLKAPLFIGDTPGCEAAAMANRAPFAFVSYGYGKCSNMHLTASSFGELRQLLLT